MKTDENWFDCWFRRTILDCDWLLLFRCISQAFTLRHQCFEVQVNFLGSKNIDHRSNVGALYWRFWAKTLGHFDHQHTLFLNISFEHQHCKDVTKIEIFLPTWCFNIEKSSSSLSPKINYATNITFVSQFVLVRNVWNVKSHRASFSWSSFGGNPVPSNTFLDLRL